MKLADLAIDHPYYGSSHNYFSNDYSKTYTTATEFLAEFADADTDFNHVYRWDIYPPDSEDDKEHYSAFVGIIQQRKGIYFPIIINKITEDEVPAFITYLQKHAVQIGKLWAPLMSTTLTSNQP